MSIAVALELKPKFCPPTTGPEYILDDERQYTVQALCIYVVGLS